MRIAWPAALAALLATGPSVTAAQVSVYVGAGARYSTALVEDVIVVPVTLRPAVAPALLLSVQDELRGPWLVDGTLDVSPGGLRRHESGTTYDAGSVTTVAVTIGVRRTFSNGIIGRLAVGGLVYTGASDGVFRDGSGGLMPMGSLSGAYEVRGFLLEARYDAHRFITPALREMRFNNQRLVHRLGVTVSRRLFGARPAAP